MDNVWRLSPPSPSIRPLRVVIVSESFLPQVNGVTNSVRRILEHLAEQGHHALLVAPSGPQEYAGFPVQVVRGVGLPSYRDFPVGTATRRRLRQVIARFSPDVVHLASPAWLGHQAGRAARSLGVPVVAVYQTDLVGFAERYGVPGGVPLMRHLTTKVHGRADLTLVPSTSSRAQLEGLGIERLALWPRGVDAELFCPSRRSNQLRSEIGAQRGEVLVGYVGRLAAEKELDLLAHACRVPRARVVVVGGGPEERRLRDLLPEASFLGVRHGEDLARIVASLDVFCHTGRSETFCQSAQEALASGVPVLAPASGGPLDLIHDGVNGLLFEPGNGSELFGHLDLLVERPDLRARMGAEGVRGVRGRSWAVVNDALLEHYRAVVGLPSARVSLTG